MKHSLQTALARRQPSPLQLTQAVAALKNGGVVLLPSESSYGLFTPIGGVRSPHTTAGVKRILKLKGRRNGKFTVVAASLEQVQKCFPAIKKWSSARRSLWLRVARQVWPGPVSLVVSPRLSVRVPDMPLLRQLARRVGQPLIATSANRSGQPPAFSLTEASHQLELDQADAIVDAGRLPRRAPSAVVQVTDRGLKMLRPGPARVNKLLKKLLGTIT